MSHPFAVVALLCIAVWIWSRLFWGQIDPWLRRALRKRCGVRIEWSRSQRNRLSGSGATTKRREAVVTAAWLATCMLGLFAPAALVVTSIELGWLPQALAPVLLAASVSISAAGGRNAGLTPPREHDR